MPANTHSITMTVTGRYPHGAEEKASITTEGDGSLEHIAQTVAALLVAAGYATDTALKVIRAMEEA